jgi:aspartyl/asparaginyl beta-hydroxylase (cupin superfamily)
MMSAMTEMEARQAAQAAFSALQNRQPQQARQWFERLAAAGKADAAVLIGLTYACAALGDRPAAHQAADRALALEAGNLQALLAKADVLHMDNDGQAAAAYYRAALRAAPEPARLSQNLRNELQRARDMLAHYAGRFEQFLVGELEKAGFDNRRDARFAQSLDLMLGKKEIYPQQPRAYFFPGLPLIQFFDNRHFPWLQRLEDATDDIRAELLRIMEEDMGAFVPYVQGDPDRPKVNQGELFNNPAWSAFFLWKNGEPVPDNMARCPKTMAALADVPLPHVPGRTPSMLFSLLKPGAHIPAHHGMLNTRMIGHLPLIVPPGCSLRVGNETRAWEVGKAWLFDDSIEHEAWNTSGETRVILLFEAWRDELSERERTLVAAMLASIDAYSGKRVAWD